MTLGRFLLSLLKKEKVSNLHEEKIEHVTQISTKGSEKRR